MKVGPSLPSTVVLAAFAGGIDSFDTQMIGFTGRQIAADLAFPVGELGWLFGAGQLGGVIGAVLFGTLADRFGRVRILALAALLAAGFTMLSLTAHTYGALLCYRTLTGIGLGGVMPCFLGLGVEAMPPRTRLAMTPVLCASSPLGGAALGGSMSLLVSIAANAYPNALRATGSGWAMAIARIGQMTAPIPIGRLVAGGLAPQVVLAMRATRPRVARSLDRRYARDPKDGTVISRRGEPVRIGIIGFGRMGEAMAERLGTQGHRVAVWNRSPAPLAAARALGATICTTLAELVHHSDVILSSLFDEMAVRAVYLGADGLAEIALDGKLLIETSTIRPELGGELSRAIEAAGGRFVDSPVLGTVGPAREGRLIALVGGDPAAVADATETLQLLARAVYPLGPAGAGYAGKLAINLVKATYYAALGDGLGLARRFGIAPDAILDVIETGPGALVELPGKMPVLRGADIKPGFVIRGVLKDLEAMIAAGGGADAVPVAAGAMEAVRRAVDGGWGERDVAMIAHYAAHVVGDHTA